MNSNNLTISSQNEIIDVKQVSLYRDNKTILENINWKINQGDHWALIGLNGSGKSSLINILSGYNFPSKGSVSVLGEVFGKTNIPNLRKRIGIVSGWIDKQLPNHKTVLETIISGKFASFGIFQQIKDQDLNQAKTVLKQFHFEKFSDRKLGSLSQGERQKVLIFRALMTQPELLILDEPTNSLDLFAKEDLLDFFEKLTENRPNLTLLLITHHLDEITPLFKKVALLKEGRFYKTGDRIDVLRKETLDQFYNQEIILQDYPGNRKILIPKKT